MRNYLRLLKHPTHPWVFHKFRRETLVRFDQYCANLRLAVRFKHLSGAIVECGTWKGGMIAGLAYVFGPHRRYYLFDSFEGLPPAKDIDGERALRWQADTESPFFFDNCRASIDDARDAMRRAGIRDPMVVKGWFQDTLPRTAIEGEIAVLRMDADWYDSTMCILVNLFHKVVSGGCIIIDDYPNWEGCAKAIHDFLSENKRPERIGTYNDLVTFMVKLPMSPAARRGTTVTDSPG
jgi:O-methyltransferase